jgi:hypothetical protein
VGRTWRASVRTGGDISVGQAFGASLSRNGGVIAFDWDAPDIVYGTFDGTHGVYVNDPSVTCPVEVYCSAKTDDYDCTPRIFAGSAASLTGWDGSRIVAEEVAAFRDGMLFWGTAPAAKPFQGGVLCVAGPYVRTPVQNSGGFTQPGCTGLLTFHFSQAHMAARGLTAGTDVYAQFWYRGGSAPFESFGLSDAIRFRVCP